LPELIQGDAPPFIILTFAAAMMGVIAAQMSFIHRLGLLKLPLFSPFGRVTMFGFGVIAFVFFLINQFLALVGILFQTHFFDLFIICLFIVGKAFVISWLVWVMVAVREFN
jgi:hypothetical protein